MSFIDKMKKKINKSEALIVKVTKLSGFIRIVASTDNRDVLNSEAIGGYIKFMPHSDSKMKSITIADNTVDTITLDFVNHGGNGDIAKYVRQAKIGDKFFFRGPGPSSKIDYNCESYVFIGDTSAYPAIKANIQKILTKNKNSKISISGKGDADSFYSYFKDLPSNVNLSLEEVKFKENDFLWFAAEKSEMDKIKSRGNIPTSHYISTYWRK